MSYHDAAHAILRAAGEPLHYEEITQRALDQKLIAPQGLTPVTTISLVHDLDDTRQARYGVYYTKRKPLTLAAVEGSPGI